MYEKLLNSLPDDQAVYFADAVHPAAWQGIQRMPEKENTKIALHLAG